MGKQLGRVGEPTDLSKKEHAVNAARAILKGIPYIGSTLEQFAFGPLEELRMRRIETTLAEVAEALKKCGPDCHVATEEFVNLLEEVLPELSRATNEEKRKCFRDLLTSAAFLDAGEAAWEQAVLARKLLTDLEAPALATIAALANCDAAEPVALVSRPKPQLVAESEFDWDNPVEESWVIGYDWPIVEEWCQRMREMRLITFGSVDARGGFGGIGLTPLGRLLVRWAVGN